MKKLIALLIIGLLFGFSGSVSAKNQKNVSPQKAVKLLIEKGLTCEAQKILIGLNYEQRAILGRIVYDKISDEELTTIIEMRERDCFADVVDDTESSGEISPAVTGSYVVEFIEETTGSGGYYPSSIFRDSSSSDWMCNDGSPEWPADYIAQYYVPNSYYNRSDLRIRGTNIWASCYIKNPTASRVYSDDDIRACFGFWNVYFCGAIVPLTSDSLIWID